MSEQRITQMSWLWFVICAGVISTFFWILGIFSAVALGYYDDPNPWNWYIVTGILWLGSCVIGFGMVCLITWLVRD